MLIFCKFMRNYHSGSLSNQKLYYVSCRVDPMLNFLFYQLCVALADYTSTSCMWELEIFIHVRIFNQRRWFGLWVRWILWFAAISLYWSLSSRWKLRFSLWYQEKSQQINSQVYLKCFSWFKLILNTFRIVLHRVQTHAPASKTVQPDAMVVTRLFVHVPIWRRTKIIFHVQNILKHNIQVRLFGLFWTLNSQAEAWIRKRLHCVVRCWRCPLSSWLCPSTWLEYGVVSMSDWLS